jgi:hypothetical protein
MSEKAAATVATKEIKKTQSSSQSQRPERHAVPHSPVDHIVSLHMTVGNRAVQRLFKSGFMQAKLKIGEPNDIYEQEADRIAEQVMRMPDNAVTGGQRSAVTERKDGVQMKPG